LHTEKQRYNNDLWFVGDTNGVGNSGNYLPKNNGKSLSFYQSAEIKYCRIAIKKNPKFNSKY
jgi:hypothetical protein